MTASCPQGTVPDDDVCVHLPEGQEEEEAPEAQSAENAHRDVHGQWVAYDQIPRRPDRDSDYDAYRYPVACASGCVISGYDLDRPDEMQRRTRKRVGHGAIDIAAAKGTPVVLLDLEHQQGDAQVIYVGPLFGTTVVTRHTVREGGKLRDYIVLFGHLDGATPGLADHIGALLREGDPIGYVGDSGSAGLVHLHLEARRVRDGVDSSRLGPAALVDNAMTVVCDPRNILPTR